METILTTGPVVGKVTQRTARVLVDCSAPATIEVSATSTDEAHMQVVTTTLERPVRVATFTGLRPATTYSVAVSVNGTPDPSRSGRFRTFAEDMRHHQILVMSCSDNDYRDSRDMHDIAYNRHVGQDEAATVLHVGDQVYADKVFRACVDALHGTSRDSWPTFRGIFVQQYRSLYRNSWNQPGVRKLLANTMNLMIWDDHEVTDDWADRGLFVDANSAEHFVARCAWSVYREYQRQLWEDVDDAPDATYGKHEGHAHAWDWLGILFLDARGGRAFRQPKPDPYLSPAQWESINSHFATGGTFADVRLLVVTATVPLVFMGPKTTENYDGDANDLYGHWSHDPHREEQYKLLTLLRDWKAADPRREVVVVGGDVHVGGLFTICSRPHRIGRDTPVFRQLVASPIRLAPLPEWKFMAYSLQIKGEPRDARQS